MIRSGANCHGECRKAKPRSGGFNRRGRENGATFLGCVWLAGSQVGCLRGRGRLGFLVPSVAGDAMLCLVVLPFPAHRLNPLLFLPCLVFLHLGASPAPAAGSVEAARATLDRVLGPENARKVRLTLRPDPNGPDKYTYQAGHGLLDVEATSAVALCRGVYDYLRAHRLGTVGWAGPRLRLPPVWPDAPPTKGASPFRIRHCYNVVTFGYTTPYWDWTRWEQELDWLAMHGCNMAMDPVAAEAVSTQVWRDLGLTQAEIDPFLTGPAHLPWQRMGNIQGVGGTLSAAWHRDQIALEKKMLERMRALGIEPVVQGFAGFVPRALQRLRPGLVLHETMWNAGFPPAQRPVALLPDDPFFAEIEKRYLTKWRELFGEARYVLVDSFNEMELPKTEVPPARLLAGYGEKTFGALTAANPEAVWVLEGWIFNYQRNIWNKDTVRALAESVPAGRLFILDYANDYEPNWDDFSAFHGRAWAMGYVPNMGGKTAQTGKMDFYAGQAAATLARPDKGNLTGFTISGEGLENNEVLYELMADSAWSAQPIDLDRWLPAYAANRYGQDSPVLAETWQGLRRSVYSSFTPHPTFGWQNLKPGFGSVHRSAGYFEAVRKFLSAAPEMAASPNYRDDAIEMAALVLGLKAEEWLDRARQAREEGNNAVLESASARGLGLLLEADRLLESHSLHRLDRWLGFTRRHGGSAADKADWEREARQLVTVWGPPVNDYSCRVWSGLIRDFYVPRLKEWLYSQKSGRRMDRAAWEKKWVEAEGVSRIKPYASPALAARDLVEKTFAETLPSLEAAQPDLVGTWEPGRVDTEWRTVEWPLAGEQLARLHGVRFLYTKGNHRLHIRSAALVADGKVVAEDRHEGRTGDQHEANDYRFDVPKDLRANNGAVLRAEVQTEGGGNSFGRVILLPPRSP